MEEITLGEKIRLARLKAGLSQADLAQLLNVSRYSVIKWEANDRVPYIGLWPELINILGLDVTDLSEARAKRGKS